MDVTMRTTGLDQHRADEYRANGMHGRADQANLGLSVAVRSVARMCLCLFVSFLSFDYAITSICTMASELLMLSVIVLLA